MIGRTIGTYKVIDKLGEGGMGAVFKGVDTMVEREVAVKVLRPELARQPDVVERFRAEAVTLAKLNHTNIATLYSFFREGDEFFMVMEFVPGRTLDAMLRESGPMSSERAAAVAAKVLEGLEHAHQMSILHRDIKPANIMITAAGQVKVTDFGIARALGTARMTREGRIVGTIEYMPPERIKGQEADMRSDLYSLGIVLYELLTGRLPFENESEFELMRAQIEDTAPPFERFNVQVPAALQAVVMRALAKDAQWRYQSAAEFRAALLEAVPAAASHRTDSIRAGMVKPTRLAAPPAPGTRLATPAPPVARKRPLMLYIAAALVVFLIAAGAGFYALTRPAPKPAAARSPEPAATGTPIQPLADAPAAGSGVSDIVKGAPASQAGVSITDLTAGKPAKPKKTFSEAERRRAALRALGQSTDSEKERQRQEALKALEK